MPELDNFVAAERDRIQAEYTRRQRELNADLYAPWQPGESLMRSERKRIAAQMLHRAGIFPTGADRCLEVGYGTLGWLGELVAWGVPSTHLCGIELDATRAQVAQRILPSADLRVGDAVELPWPGGSFQLVVVSAVFTSILDSRVRQIVAREIMRVLSPRGGLLWYDFAVNNPRNANVRKVTRRELQALFPRLHGRIRSVTLLPPLARWIAGKSWLLATCLSAIPVLRTHLLAVLTHHAANTSTDLSDVAQIGDRCFIQ